MLYKVVIYSGGMDSYTLLHLVHDSAKNIGHPSEQPSFDVHALSFDYGQLHAKELDCAQAECKALGIKHTLINMQFMTKFLKGSALTDPEAVPMPEGAYDGENMRKTVVPGRNTLMLAFGLAYAEGLVLDCESRNLKGNALLYYGAHSGDHFIYPDCRPDYIDALRTAITLGSAGRVRLIAPFERETKISILRLGRRLGLDYKNTWTCYKGQYKACGVCGSCDERLEAFAKNGLRDPVPYSSLGRWAETEANPYPGD